MQLINSIFNWFKKAVPEPKPKNIHTQIGVHFEEVSEMINSLTSKNQDTLGHLDIAEQALIDLATHLKQNNNVLDIKDEIELLDALCDQIVTATGVGYMLGMNLPDALGEVNKSNYSKFVNGEPIFNENLKIMKGPDYFIANVKPFI